MHPQDYSSELKWILLNLKWLLTLPPFSRFLFATPVWTVYSRTPFESAYPRRGTTNNGEFCRGCERSEDAAGKIKCRTTASTSIATGTLWGVKGERWSRGRSSNVQCTVSWTSSSGATSGGTSRPWWTSWSTTESRRVQWIGQLFQFAAWRPGTAIRSDGRVYVPLYILVNRRLLKGRGRIVLLMYKVKVNVVVSGRYLKLA